MDLATFENKISQEQNVKGITKNMHRSECNFLYVERSDAKNLNFDKIGLRHVLALTFSLESNFLHYFVLCLQNGYFCLSDLYLLILLVMCSIVVLNVVLSVKMFYLESKPPNWLQVRLIHCLIIEGH